MALLFKLFIVVLLSGMDHLIQLSCVLHAHLFSSGTAKLNIITLIYQPYMHICYHHMARFPSMVKSVSGECHGGHDLKTGNGDSSLCGEVELAW
jgi:hypothetical protein